MAKKGSSKGSSKGNSKSKSKSSRTVTGDVNKAYDTLKGASTAPKLDKSNPFGFITDDQRIKNALDESTNAAYDVQTKEANLGLNRAEDTAYANTQNAVNELRKNMVGSASSGGNAGAAGATALQAILGLGQQNTGLVTESMQNIQKVAGERTAALKQNAVDAISQSNSARAQQASAANEKYNADATRSAEALAALGALAGTEHTNLTNKQMNTATNKANKQIAKTTQKQEIKYKGGYKVK